jgi:short-subunit dehydrogenase
MDRRLALVTGASAGIGAAFARIYASHGYDVALTARRQDPLESLADEVRLRYGVEAVVFPADLAETDAPGRIADHLTAHGRTVDVLVNNAGYGAAGPTELITDEDWRAQYDVNVFGLMAMIRAFVPQMRARGAGRIVNVSSLGGRLTLPFLGSYNSTKYAVESLSDALRAELHPFGVRVSIVEPGVIDTGFTDRSMTEAEKYDRADSPYRPVLDRMGEIRKMSDSTAVGPDCIARAIERAATARRPRPRYVAPLRAALGIGFLRALPTTWADALLRIAFGLTRRRFRAALAANSKLPQLPPRQINA